MDTALFLTLFLFAVQTAAGVAPMKWPQHKWLADGIFYLSGFFAIVCLVVYVVTNREWLVPSFQPSHVIALGLAISLGELLWQWRKAPPPDIQVVALQNQIAQLHQQLADAATRVAPSPEQRNAKKIISYSERDIRELLDGLTDAQELMEKRIFPVTNRITQVTANWRGYIPNHGVQGFAKLLKEMNAALPDEVWKPIDELLERYGRVAEQIRFAMALDHEAARGEIGRTLKIAIDSLEKLPENPSEVTKDLVKTQFLEAYRQGEIAYNWVTIARERISMMTQNLRTKGVTGYE